MRRKVLIIIAMYCVCIGHALTADALKTAIDSLPDIDIAKDTLKTLNLKEVEVLAQRKRNDETTSYRLNRLALDHHQMLNLTGLETLLPGGKTVNPTLTDDSRLGLRSSTLERGNASFGTAVEIDGMRLDNNGMMNETAGASTRGISSSNIESVEIVAGIPSVEYGDISGGVVKVNTRRGNSPFILEASSNPYTKQISLNKGFTIKNWGTFNASVEHAQSYTSITSPYTGYQRNALSLFYSKIVRTGASTINIKGSVAGNLGGYNSKADPDAFADTYQKARDNQLRANVAATWIHENIGIGQLRSDLSASFSMSDRLTEDYINKSSSSSQPLLRAMDCGYFMADLGPTGYWYERSYLDQKPQTWQLKWKGTLTSMRNKLLLGLEYKSSQNKGRGLYYENLSLAPTWRPYRYDELPALNVFSIFAEDHLTIDRLQLTGGLRAELTPKAVLSPRVNIKYSPDEIQLCDHPLLMNFHAGYGKSVKLPSLQILYPADSYLDKLAFTPGSTADNKAFYAYNTYVSKAERNPELKWQYNNQIDVGGEAEWHGATLSVSFFWHKTHHPY